MAFPQVLPVESIELCSITAGWEVIKGAHEIFPHFSLADITGPIILQTYRAIADYEKNSRTEMALKTGDMVEVVEKSESGKAHFSGKMCSCCKVQG